MNADQPIDLLLKGGRVIDPANHIDGRLDVAIGDGKILRLAEEIDPRGAGQVVDASGLLVAPGLVDLHTHLYTFRPTPLSYVEGVNADAHFLAAGVTTAVDTGTAGWEHFPDFKETCIDRSKVRILVLLNIARKGMVDASSEQVEADMQVQAAAGLARTYPGLIVGIKSAHYWTRLPWDAQHRPWTSVERGLEAADLCGLPLMVDFWPRPPERPYPDLILKMLRPGDIHTHVFAQQFPVLAADGRVQDYMFAAHERGVIFDLGHGAGSFWFRKAVPALRGGFPPDTLSTDLHMANVNGPVVDLAWTLSKFLSMGMPLGEVIWRATARPAEVIGRADLGRLSPGCEADVAVFRLREGDFFFSDCGRARLRGRFKLECALTLRAGEVVYDPGGLSMPDWEQAPAPYWEMPELQP